MRFATEYIPQFGQTLNMSGTPHVDLLNTIMTPEIGKSLQPLSNLRVVTLSQL